ncbi:unnamed protein product, partial [marine sediment metagenome]
LFNNQWKIKGLDQLNPYEYDVEFISSTTLPSISSIKVTQPTRSPTLIQTGMIDVDRQILLQLSDKDLENYLLAIGKEKADKIRNDDNFWKKKVSELNSKYIEIDDEEDDLMMNLPVGYFIINDNVGCVTLID